MALAVGLAQLGRVWAAGQVQTTPPPGAPAAVQAAAPASSPDDLANFIAGYPCREERLRALQETNEWKDFATGIRKSWAALEDKRLLPMRAWSEIELAEANAATKTVFYPFGGPDLLTPFVLFPNADTYVLLGLEFVGKLHAFDKAEAKNVQAYTSNLSAALWDFFNKSYFITHHMDETLTGDKVDGVLPLLCFFLKRTGNGIVAVKRLEFGADGRLVEHAPGVVPPKERRPYGVKVEFSAGGTERVRTLYFFSCDLSDGSFLKTLPIYKYCDGLIFETTFIKSASYLLHYKEFSNIRSMVLAKSRFVLQDDTGVPYKYFPAVAWDCQLYGEYIKPIADFSANLEQADLKAAYADTARVKKLPFHLGYHWSTNKDSVLYFKKRSAP
jgi:hypothetical protein